MYCPNCGSNNQAEVKFRARCGTTFARRRSGFPGIVTDQTARSLKERAYKPHMEKKSKQTG